MIQFIKRVSGNGRGRENDCCGVEIKEVKAEEEKDACCSNNEDEVCCEPEKKTESCC